MDKSLKSFIQTNYKATKETYNLQQGWIKQK